MTTEDKINKAVNTVKGLVQKAGYKFKLHNDESPEDWPEELTFDDIVTMLLEDIVSED